jgi:hypothetical protein
MASNGSALPARVMLQKWTFELLWWKWVAAHVVRKQSHAKRRNMIRHLDVRQPLLCITGFGSLPSGLEDPTACSASICRGPPIERLSHCKHPDWLFVRALSLIVEWSTKTPRGSACKHMLKSPNLRPV